MGNYTLVRGPSGNLGHPEDKEKAGSIETDITTRAAQRGGGEWEFFDLPQQWSIQYRAHISAEALQF